MSSAVSPGVTSMPPRPDTSRLAPFWRAAAAGRLEIPRCAACGQFNWYPVAVCTACGGEAHVWTGIAADPCVFSWAVARRALDPRMAALTPYATVMVTFEDAPGVRLVTRLIDAEPERLQIGTTGRLAFRDLGYPAVETGIIAPLLVLA